MDATWSVLLVDTFFAHPNYLFVKCWVSIIHLFPNTVNEMGQNLLCSFGEGRARNMPFGIPCDSIMVIIDHSNAAMAFVFTAFHALSTALANHCYFATEWQVLVEDTRTICMDVMPLLVIMLSQ